MYGFLLFYCMTGSQYLLLFYETAVFNMLFFFLCLNVCVCVWLLMLLGVVVWGGGVLWGVGGAV